MNNKDDEFFIIGHRGAAGDYFENSIAGFEHARDLAIDAIELDIHEHNGDLWVIHDPELDRLTNGHGLLADAEDLAALKLKNGDGIPRLREVLDLLWDKIAINIEIKTIVNPQSLLTLLNEYPETSIQDGLPQVLISSFNHRRLLDLRQLDCPWPIAPISCGVPIATDRVIEALQPWSWHFDDEYVDFELIASLSERSIPSLVYTVNNTERAKQLQANGVVGVFTDFPADFAHLSASPDP